jgi:hypothetical protein
MEDNSEIFKNMVSSPDEELNEQIQHKFIRNVVKPYAMNPFMNGEIDTTKEEKPLPKSIHPPRKNRTNISDIMVENNFQSTENSVSTPISSFGNNGQFTLQLTEHTQKLDDILALVEKPSNNYNPSLDRIIIFILLGINIVLLYLFYKEKTNI